MWYMTAQQRCGESSWRRPVLSLAPGLGKPVVWGQLPVDKEGRLSVYRVTDLIGTSTESWEDAAAAAIKVATGTLRDLRVAEVVAQDIHIDETGGLTYRTKLRVSFKYEA
jgi:flavin-binding protein dodecin